MDINSVLERIDTDLENSLTRLMTFLKIPSISTDPNYSLDCERAADFLVDDLKSIGAIVEKRQTPGHPMVVGHYFSANEDLKKPHILFYGHYDVQPIDPIELWKNDPFDPKLEKTKKGPVIRGRGASDDKGQLMTFIEACRAWKFVYGDLPCRISFLFEGEEESGSPSLVPFLKGCIEELSSDIVFICDTGLFQSKTPAIVTMLRGLLGEEITITAANKDLHSGMYGGLAINPIHVLNRILASLHDKEGRCTVPKFYEGVSELSPEIKSQWNALEFNYKSFLKQVNLHSPAGEKKYTPLEMIWSRPTCEVNGIRGGYVGEGFKTVLPSEATAKISFRLVDRQDPLKIRQEFRKFVKTMLPEDCDVSFNSFGASKGTKMPISTPEFEKARRALTEEWGVEAAYIGCGGSIPIAGHFQDIFGVTPLLIGFGKDDDQLHSPNEKYDLESFHKGIRSWARILYEINFS